MIGYQFGEYFELIVELGCSLVFLASLVGLATCIE